MVIADNRTRNDFKVADQMKNNYELFGENSQAIIYNLMTDDIQRMLDFNHMW